MIRPSWNERIARAEELAQRYAFATEVLRFYTEVARFQKTLHTSLRSTNGTSALNHTGDRWPDQPDLCLILPQFHHLLRLATRVGPAALAQCAKELAEDSGERRAGFLTAYWKTGDDAEANFDPSRTFFAHTLLEPYAEYLAEQAELPGPTDSGASTCPLCGRRPVVGVLRAEGDGSKRSLVCSLCATEWEYRRIICPACGEEDPHKLAVYIASEFEHVRVEACDTCQTYLKTVDLTKNGLAVPVVDELATTPLDLWAQEQGYGKLQDNLLGF